MNTSFTFSPDKPVLVTGATGYVAGHIIRILLDAGAMVHAAVRDPDNAAKRAHLDAMAAAYDGEIRYFAADLLKPGSHAEAMAGCSIVFHTASPFILGGPDTDAQRDFVDPALQGTRDVLETANDTATVERVVLTSSCAAINGGQEDLKAIPDHVMTEDHWNRESTIENNPYNYSKTVAEQAAWEIANAQNQWRLVVINPSFILGPGTAANQTSASFDIIRGLAKAGSDADAPMFSIGMVDVRDVAEAHVRAAYLPDAHGRNIVNAQTLTMGEIATALGERFGPERQFPRDPGLPEGVIPWAADNTKARRELGMEFRPVIPAVHAMFEQMIETGQV